MHEQKTEVKPMNFSNGLQLIITFELSSLWTYVIKNAVHSVKQNNSYV